VTPNASEFLNPAIISKGKGKAKFCLDEEDVPLAQLKRLKHVQPVSTNSLSELESAALSLTALQDDSRFNGPIQNFLQAPLLLSHGRHVNMMPKPGCFFATEPQTYSAVTMGTSHAPHSHAIQGATSILQVSSQSCLAPSAVTELTQ
jgi:hypothetical protein